MTDHPIPFKGPMINALLEGRKTQTRRVINPQPDPGTRYIWSDLHGHCWINDVDGEWPIPLKYAPGDRLWVREDWRTWRELDDLPPRDLKDETETIKYEADGATRNCFDLPDPGRLRSWRYMPRWASRITLTVTDVSVYGPDERGRNLWVEVHTFTVEQRNIDD